MKEYVVLELCQTETKIEPSVLSYEDVRDARALFYNKCAVAVKSAYLTHTIILMNAAGGIIEGPKCFRHVQPDPGPEEEDEGGEDVNAPA